MVNEERTGKQENKEYDILIIELLQRADERQKKCVYQFTKAIVGEG